MKSKIINWRITILLGICISITVYLGILSEWISSGDVFIWLPIGLLVLFARVLTDRLLKIKQDKTTGKSRANIINGVFFCIILFIIWAIIYQVMSLLQVYSAGIIIVSAIYLGKIFVVSNLTELL